LKIHHIANQLYNKDNIKMEKAKYFNEETIILDDCDYDIIGCDNHITITGKMTGSIIGHNNKIVGNINDVIGNSNEVTGDVQDVNGYNNKITGNVLTTINGSTNYVSGDAHTVNGNNNVVTGTIKKINGSYNTANIATDVNGYSNTINTAININGLYNVMNEVTGNVHDENSSITKIFNVRIKYEDKLIVKGMILCIGGLLLGCYSGKLIYKILH